jgi:putative transposase
MPWKETCAVDERERFVENWLASEASKTELCEIYGISRKTAYKWLGRFRKEGQPGLMDRGRAPHHCPHALNASVKRLLLAARKAHPRWGPRKILAWIAEGKHGRRPIQARGIGETSAEAAKGHADQAAIRGL